MATRGTTRVFDRTDRFVEGWYWAKPSNEVRPGRIVAVQLLGRDLVLWRDTSGRIRCHDAYCPHMGAHLAEGSVDGDQIRCFFHHWRFDAEGRLTDIPCQDTLPKVGVQAWPVGEAYGLVWVWCGGTEAKLPLPYVPELEGQELRALLGNQFVKGCHPNVVMINAIDEQHFHSVHPMASSLAVGQRFAVKPLGDNLIQFDNAEPVPHTNAITRFISRFYDGPLTYRMNYWNGSTGSVTVGPDRQHFHILFALRPNAAGETEGQTVLLTERRSGLRGLLYNRVCLELTRVVGDYFAKGDTEVFQTIRFDLATPIPSDRSILRFIQHLERQAVSSWGAWEALPAATASARGLELVEGA
jgi:phenylpropionate dioxygenase-like ring-hydroxylating dioxygenase large terminal subunit